MAKKNTGVVKANEKILGEAPQPSLPEGLFSGRSKFNFVIFDFYSHRNPTIIFIDRTRQLEYIQILSRRQSNAALSKAIVCKINFSFTIYPFF
jgi:hypothetical protein